MGAGDDGAGDDGAGDDGAGDDGAGRTARRLRDALGRYATGVVVVCSATPDGPAGMAVNSFTSVSLDPPLVAFGAAQTSTTWPRLAAAGGFAISVLAAEHEELCRRFATPGADRFGGSGWDASGAGHPVVPGAAAWFDTVVRAVHPAGDHHLVVAEVGEWAVAPAAPLVFHGGRYATLGA